MENITKKDIQELLAANNKVIEERLSEQTAIILDAVDEKIGRLETRIDSLERRIDELDLKFSQKIDTLTNTLDAFLKRMTDMETEFEMMKADINRMKRMMREKLGFEL